MKLNIELLEKMCNGFGPSGYENEVQKFVRDYGSKYAEEVLYDRTGSVIFRHGNGKPKIMLAGHCDEIGFVVSSIEESGYLRISNIGGWWDQTLLTQEILIRPFKNGEKIIGVIAAKPPHVLEKEERKKVVTMDKMFVDIGCKSAEEVKELGIRVGDPAVPRAFFRTMKRVRKGDDNEEEREVNLAVAKAFDDRIGAFIVLEVLRRLAEENIEHPNTVYGVSTVQEEVGLRGARTAAQMIKPDIGFAIDVDISGDVPGTKEIDQKMGEGVCISAGDSSMIPNPRLRKFVIDLAEEKGIKWQTSFLKRGGTDAGIIHITGIGAPSLFLGIATRHIHSHHGILDLGDVENAIQLLVEIIKNIDEDTSASFTAL